MLLKNVVKGMCFKMQTFLRLICDQREFKAGLESRSVLNKAAFEAATLDRAGRRFHGTNYPGSDNTKPLSGKYLNIIISLIKSYVITADINLKNAN